MKDKKLAKLIRRREELTEAIDALSQAHYDVCERINKEQIKRDPEARQYFDQLKRFLSGDGELINAASMLTNLTPSGISGADDDWDEAFDQ